MMLQDLREKADEFGLCEPPTKTSARAFGECQESPSSVIRDADIRVQIRLGGAARYVRVRILAQPALGLECVGLWPTFLVVVHARYVDYDPAIRWQCEGKIADACRFEVLSAVGHPTNG